MRDLKNAYAIYLKGFLLLLGGLLSATLIIVEQPTIKVCLLLAVSIWCFARCYYFIFYVIQHYVDDDYKFAGIWSFIRYILRKRSLESEKESKEG